MSCYVCGARTNGSYQVYCSERCFHQHEHEKEMQEVIGKCHECEDEIRNCDDYENSEAEIDGVEEEVFICSKCYRRSQQKGVA